jgi:hypothetical protein
MKKTITAAFLALSITATAQRDSLVCFTIHEAYEILDTLHSGVDHRRARIILGTMYAKQAQVSKSYAIEADSLRSWRKADQVQTAEALRIRDQAVKDAEFWKGKAKGKGWRGFGLGILVSIGAYIGAQQLTR